MCSCVSVRRILQARKKPVRWTSFVCMVFYLTGWAHLPKCCRSSCPQSSFLPCFRWCHQAGRSKQFDWSFEGSCQEVFVKAHLPVFGQVGFILFYSYFVFLLVWFYQWLSSRSTHFFCFASLCVLIVVNLEITKNVLDWTERFPTLPLITSWRTSTSRTLEKSEVCVSVSIVCLIGRLEFFLRTCTWLDSPSAFSDVDLFPLLGFGVSKRIFFVQSDSCPYRGLGGILRLWKDGSSFEEPAYSRFQRRARQSCRWKVFRKHCFW